MTAAPSSAGLALRRGLVTGALAGVWVAFADFGATWLWLPLARDRLWLLLRLLASLVPVGAATGALLALFAVVTWRPLTKRFPTYEVILWPLPITLVAVPLLARLARALCAGGMMSRLAARYPLQLALSVLLPCVMYGSLALSTRAARRLRAHSERHKSWVALSLLGSSFLLGKVNQTVLPNLYDYLHALLAVVVWCVAALGLATLGFGTQRLARVASLASRTSTAVVLGVVLLFVAVTNARSLDDNLNVRVAMFDARSPTSRALLSAADPYLRKLEQPRARSTRSSAQPVRASVSGLPTTPGAHVLLITIDALRADHLGSYGYTRPVSPQLDALAQKSVLFERAYAQAPHSSYSLCSLHTSAYVHEIVELGRPLPTATLATALRDHGYHSAAFFTDGIFHTEGQKLIPLRDGAFGFALFDHTNRESEQQTDRVLAEVDRIKQRGEPPSLLWVHYFDVHEPYQETTFGSGEVDRYDSEILHVDREVARLINELKARLSRELVIAITADHGEEFRDHGGVYHGSTLFDEQVRVPLILSVPGLPASRFAAPVESIDIAPTLLGAVGAPVPTSMRGRDLRALATSKASAGPVFSAVLTKRMALSWPYKLIADLRFGLYELYDLSKDPQERKNLAGQEPERLRSQRELVYAWLDSIGDAPPASGGSAANGEPAFRRALELGRLGDRRAVAPTCALLLDPKAPTELRVEAGQILAKLADPSSVPSLIAGLSTEPKRVAAEAAIALGRLYDDRARPALRELMHVEDPYLRARAAVSLGRLHDTHAVPALIDALWVAPTQYEREEAVRWLGRLRDPRAIEPLLSLLSEFSLRYLLAVALGQIGGQSGDTRAYEALVGMLDWESRTNIRDEVVRGLGLLGDPRAIPVLLATLAREPGLKNTAESLVRLGALKSGQLGGVDLNKKTKPATGLAHCQEGPFFHDWDYLARTHCTSTGPKVELPLALPRGGASTTGAVLIVHGKRADSAEPISCTLTISDVQLGTLNSDGEFREQRFELPTKLAHGQNLELGIVCPSATARLTLDHALLLNH